MYVYYLHAILCPSTWNCNLSYCAIYLWYCFTDGGCKLSDRHYFLCNNGDCIKKQWRCDREKDCKDGDDETGCGKLSYPLYVLFLHWLINCYTARTDTTRNPNCMLLSCVSHTCLFIDWSSEAKSRFVDYVIVITRYKEIAAFSYQKPEGIS